MGEVRARAMSFSTDETAAFLQNVSGSEVDEETVNALKERTDGWVMGLRLVTLSVNNIAELKSRATVLPGEQRTLDYLATEALSRQPRDIQTWLLETSILDRFCAPLCEAVCLPAETGESSNLNGDGFIQWLMESNLFVIPLDQRREWFRYHHLFGELLQNQLKNVLDAEEIYRLYSRASQWFLENGHVAEAIDYALAANDVMGAAQIVERNRYAIQDKDEWFTLEKWLSKLPEGVKQTRPGLLIAQAKVSLVHQDFPGVLASIEEAERIMGADQSNQTEDDPLWGEIYHLKGYFTYFQGLGSIANQHQRRALELLPESNQLDMAEAKLHFGLSLQMCGEKVNAIDDFNQQLRAGGHLSPIQRTRLWSGLAFIHLLEGDLPEVLYPAQQCQAITANQKDVYAEAYMQYLDTCVHFMQNNQDKASRNLSWIEDQRFIIQKRVAIDGFCESALIHQVQGQADKVAAATSRLLEFAAETQDPANLLIASSCQARLSLMQADTASALEWLGKTDLNYDAGIMLWWIEIPRLTACRVLIAEGSQRSLEQATEKLLQYKIENQAVHNTYQVIVILPLIALAYHKLSNDDEALKVLKEALELGRPGGWIWPFIEGGASMAGLLKRLRRGSVATELGYYIDRILAVFSTPKEKVDPFDQTGLVKPLTERELQVLQLLTSTLSATEIAAELVVSVNTVRMHTKNIYRKLVVNSRIEAVERAREMGLI
jgi:LuxR family maltose regulon positive regulatory protein